MLTYFPSDIQPNPQPANPPPTQELNRLLAAAVVSQRFCSLLLSDPQKALASGYQGESFHLSDEEQNWLASCGAASLVELAVKLVKYQQDLCYEVPQLFSANTPSSQPLNIG